MHIAFIAFYDSTRPPTCADPAYTAPICTVPVTPERGLRYVGPIRRVEYWRGLAADGAEVLCQGGPEDLIGCPDKIVKRDYYIAEFQLKEVK